MDLCQETSPPQETHNFLCFHLDDHKSQPGLISQVEDGCNAYSLEDDENDDDPEDGNGGDLEDGDDGDPNGGTGDDIEDGDDGDGGDDLPLNSIRPLLDMVDQGGHTSPRNRIAHW